MCITQIKQEQEVKIQSHKLHISSNEQDKLQHSPKIR